MRTIALLLLLSRVAAAAEGTVNGLYPLWEQTGDLHEAGTLQIGFLHAQLGLGPVQVGTQPFLDLYGTANAQAKLALWRGQRLRLALVPGWYRVPAAAQARAIGNLRTVKLYNPYGPVTLVPVALAASLLLSPRLRIHAAGSVLGQWADDARDRMASAGAAALLELRANARWAAMVHAGVEGVPVTRQTHAGLSFAYRLRHLDLRLGYARRFEDGESSGVLLFDGALLF